MDLKKKLLLFFFLFHYRNKADGQANKLNVCQEVIVIFIIGLHIY